MDELFSDWRFLVLVAGFVAAVAEARLRIARHAGILSDDKLAAWNADRATMAATLSELGRDISEMRSTLERLGVKGENSVERIWSSLEKNTERIAKLEGRMNGAL
jgi:hypothetical protein